MYRARGLRHLHDEQLLAVVLAIYMSTATLRTNTWGWPVAFFWGGG
jgi:hypothetical protein